MHQSTVSSPRYSYEVEDNRFLFIDGYNNDNLVLGFIQYISNWIFFSVSFSFTGFHHHLLLKRTNLLSQTFQLLHYLTTTRAMPQTMLHATTVLLAYDLLAFELLALELLALTQ